MCDCAQKLNEVLKGKNAALATSFQVRPEGLKLVYLAAVEKIDKSKRKSLPYVSMTYCPFCGEKLP